MNKYRHNCCNPPKRKHKKKFDNKKIGLIMLMLGAITIMALFLPLKCWVFILSFTLAFCGIILLKSH